MKPLLLLLFFISPALAVSVTTTLTLVNEPGFNRINVTIDPGLAGSSSSSTSTLTGTVQAKLDISPQTGTTSELTLSNGRVNGTNMTFARNLFIAAYNIQVTNLSAAIFTTTPPGSVDPANGQFSAEQHSFVIDQGAITGSTSGLIGSNAIAESFTPENPASGTGTGTGLVILTPAGDSGIFRNYQVVVQLPVSITDTVTSGTLTVNLTATGTVKAAGVVQVPRTAYLAWTVDEGMPGAAFASDADGDGIPLGYLWAMGLGVADDGRDYLPRPDPAVGKGFSITLPTAGTVAPVILEQSSDLATWTQVSAAGISSGANPLPAGTGGTIQISPDSSAARFLRARVVEP